MLQFHVPFPELGMNGGDACHTSQIPGVLPIARLSSISRSMIENNKQVITTKAFTQLNRTGNSAAVKLYSLPGNRRVHVLEHSRPTPDRLEVVVESNCGGWVVMSEAWMPGWKATVNGADAEVVRTDHVARAVRVEAGRSVVRTKYEPWSQRIGWALTLVCSLAALVVSRRSS